MRTVPEEVKNQIKESVDVEALLAYLGFKITRATSSEVRAPCIIHGGDNPTGFSMRTSTRKWKCFTHKCEVGADGRVENDLISLIMKVQGIPFIDALQFLSDFSGLCIDVRSKDLVEDESYKYKKDARKFVKLASRAARPLSPEAVLSEKELARSIEGRDDYFVKEGFLPETLEHFEIGGKFDKDGVWRATVPIRDHNGVLVGMSARRTDGDDEPRYKIEWAFEKARVLYNLWNARISGADTIIIVEGFKAAWAVHEAGFPCVVACMGSIITEEQVALLVSSRFMKCVLMFDGDKAGRDGMEKSIPKLERALRVVPAYLPDGLSPDSINREELNQFLNIHVHC